MSYTVKYALVLAAAVTAGSLMTVTGCGSSGTESSSGALPGDSDGGGGTDGQSSSTTEGGSSSGATVAEACDAYVKAFHKRLSTCFPLAFGNFPGKYEQSVTSGCAGELEAPGVVAKPADYLRCAQALDALSCDERLDITGTEATLPACAFAKGTLTNGDACKADVQCAGGRCAIEDATKNACGVCAVAPAVVASTRGDLGDTCDASQNPCKQSLACNLLQNKCVARLALGAPCSGNEYCSLDAYCSTTCKALPTAGQPCPSGGECASGHSCVVSTMKCEKNTYVEGGQKCDESAARPCYEGFCTNVCSDYADEGAACGPGSSRCRAPFVCADGTCVDRAKQTCK